MSKNPSSPLSKTRNFQNLIIQKLLLHKNLTPSPPTTMKNSFKIIEKIFTAPVIPEGAGAKVRRIIGAKDLRRLDPFLLFDHFSTKLPGGFPDHPHRGFETVTYMLEGEILHEDFKGNKGRLYPGDLQWMTAGKGIVHAEVPGSAEQESVGFQLWVNLAAKDKYCDPEYQEIPKESVLSVTHEGVTVKIIAGEAFGKQGPVYARTPALYLDVHMSPYSTYEQVIPKGWNAFSYLYKGKALYGENKQCVETDNCVVLKQDDNELLSVRTSSEEAKLILVAGQPLNEHVVLSRMFVLNSIEELNQTNEDFKKAQNGFEGAHGWESEITKMSKAGEIDFSKCNR